MLGTLLDFNKCLPSLSTIRNIEGWEETQASECVCKCECECVCVCVCVCTWARVSMEVSCWEREGTWRSREQSKRKAAGKWDPSVLKTDSHFVFAFNTRRMEKQQTACWVAVLAQVVPWRALSFAFSGTTCVGTCSLLRPVRKGHSGVDSWCSECCSDLLSSKKVFFHHTWSHSQTKELLEWTQQAAGVCDLMV